MPDTVIEIEHLYKEYRLGLIGYGTLREDLQTWWAKARGKEDPNSMLFSENQSRDGKAPDHILALNDINLEVKRGERLGIIGANGAGKTTLLKILSRIASPTKGTAKIKGRVASLIAVGTGFHEELTGRENIYLNGSILGLRKFEIKQRFDEIVDFAGVEQFIDTPVKRYSSGMYVRLGFAVAAHLEPDVLIVDEVLAVGDAEFRKKAIGKMKEVSKGEGRTVLFVSHNMFSIKNLCNKAVLLESGRIRTEGKVNEVIDQYVGISSDSEESGEASWASPDVAPGDERLRLRSVRVVCDNDITDTVKMSREFQIEMDYWNLKDANRLYVSIHIYNSMDVCVFVSSNIPGACKNPDPWFNRPYPNGLFRTSCTIPGNFLNEGTYRILIGINPPIIPDPMVLIENVISFSINDDGAMRKEHVHEWPGVVRVLLDWKTV